MSSKIRSLDLESPAEVESFRRWLLRQEHLYCENCHQSALSHNAPDGTCMFAPAGTRYQNPNGEWESILKYAKLEEL